MIRLETEHSMTISDCDRHLDEDERRRVAAFLLDGLS